ncbi:hypothetical protein OO014_02465 [Intrasporangium calvum]|uniref:Uncharacterized protein n=1 Tax=Intrasporangium calvum TaxID=53358 RepID=A0ABT5GEJ1_9MICO|nr:hypothetical protein [Intrasporangium calvum]MDC5696106.1 hypothetical protein [Intrasporangium calvum]
MNLTDLRTELDLRAQDLTADVSSLTAGIDGKVRATKRRRAAAGAVAACAVAAVVGVAAWNGMARPTTPAPAGTNQVTLRADALPSRPVAMSPDDVVKDGLRFRAETLAGDRLAAGAIGDLGQRSLSVRWRPTTQQVTYAVECWLPSDTDDAAWRNTWVRHSVPGQEGHFSSTCQRDLPADGVLASTGVTPGEPGEGDRTLGVGIETTLDVELVDRDGNPVTNPQARIAVGVYELGPRTEVHDETRAVVLSLPEVIEHQGYAYQLTSMVDGSLPTTTLPSSVTPTGMPFLVSYGSTTEPGDATAPTFSLTGLDVEASSLVGGGWSTVAQPARGAGRVGLALEGPAPESGTAFIAIYTPVP